MVPSNQIILSCGEKLLGRSNVWSINLVRVITIFISDKNLK